MSSPNTTPLTYNGYVNQIATLAVVNTTTSGGVVSGVDPAFNTLIPQMLNYAELRIQRDVDLLPLLTSNSSYSLVTGSNLLQVSVNDFVTIQTISVVNGTATIPLLPTTKEFLQNVYNDSSATYQGQPLYFAMYGGDAATGGNTTQNIIVGPYPNQSYPVLLTGTIRMPRWHGAAWRTMARWPPACSIWARAAWTMATLLPLLPMGASSRPTRT